jgi:hypothetical protein
MGHPASKGKGVAEAAPFFLDLDFEVSSRAKPRIPIEIATSLSIQRMA